MRKYIRFFIFILCMTLCADCGTSSLMFYADMNNPCTRGAGDPLSCAQWKKNFPKEYAKYQKRMEKYKNSGKLEKYQTGSKSN